MKLTLFFLPLIFLFLRIFYVKRIKGKARALAILELLGGVESITYLFPLKCHRSDDPQTRRLKITANVFLYLFFIFFAALLLYGLFTEGAALLVVQS